MITLPVRMQLRDWADRVILDLNKYGHFGQLNDEREWQRWGVQFLNDPTIGRAIPNPYRFKDWRDWAERMCEVLG